MKNALLASGLILAGDAAGGGPRRGASFVCG